MERPDSRKTPLIAAIIVVIALMGLTVYALQASNGSNEEKATTSSQNQSDTTTGSTDPASEAAPTPSERMALSFTDSGFEPEQITVKKGTVITVTNNSSKDVQFSSNEHPSHRDNTEMNLKTLSPGESESYTATVVGTWGFHDHIDDSKMGTVVVTE